MAGFVVGLGCHGQSGLDGGEINSQAGADLPSRSGLPQGQRQQDSQRLRRLRLQWTMLVDDPVDDLDGVPSVVGAAPPNLGQAISGQGREIPSWQGV